jgi:hypothetical protein
LTASWTMSTGHEHDKQTQSVYLVIETSRKHWNANKA